MDSLRSKKISCKQYIFQFFIFLLILSLVKNPSISLNSAKNGLFLWFNILLPSLLPFFILSELFITSGLVNHFGKLLGPIMKHIFNISGEGSFPLIMSFVSGYPLGAKLTSRLRSLNIISKPEGDRLITLASTSGPSYILGSVLIGMLSINNLKGLMIIPHYLGAITVGLVFSCSSRRNSLKLKYERVPSKNASYSNNHNTASLSSLISDSVKDSVNSILVIGGFVIIYNVIIDILLSSKLIYSFIIDISNLFSINPELLNGIFAGFIELTTGCHRISSMDIHMLNKFLILNFLIGFGGLSILSQAISFITQTDISIKKYLVSKVLHGFISTIYTYILYFLYYKNEIMTSFSDNIVKENMYNFKNWIHNLYLSTKLSFIVCIFFIILSTFIYSISTLKKEVS